MRTPLAITTVAAIAMHVNVYAGPLRACAQLRANVDTSAAPIIKELAIASDPGAKKLYAQFMDCLAAHNICTVMFEPQIEDEMVLEAGDLTAELPERHASQHGASFVIFAARSIPALRNDANQYCVVAESAHEASVEAFDVYGWQISVNGSISSLQKQAPDRRNSASQLPISARTLAAKLWFFATQQSVPLHP
jgi:hypothetical protein